MESSRIIVASLLLLAFAATAEARVVPELLGEDANQQTCNNVRFKKMCQSLTKLPKVTTPRELLLASMRVAAEKAKEAKSRVDEFAARSRQGKPMESIIDTCSKGYGDVVDMLEETQKIVAAKGTQVDLNTQLSSAVTSADDCNNAFQDFPEMNDPFLAMQKNVWRLVDNVLNIAVVVKQSGDAHAHAHAHVH